MIRAAVLLLLVFAVVLPATASERASSGRWWLAAGPAVGVLSLDDHLADYRWDTRPQATFGAQALAGRGPLAGGVRLDLTGTTQGTGLQAAPAELDVDLTSLELAMQVRVVTVAGVELWGGLQAGRVFVRYSPDTVTVDTGGEPLTVALDGIDEWIYGLGLELRYHLGAHLDLGLQAERSSFALDTAHRQGDAIVHDRERFGNWGARLLVAWSWTLS